MGIKQEYALFELYRLNLSHREMSGVGKVKKKSVFLFFNKHPKVAEDKRINLNTNAEYMFMLLKTPVTVMRLRAQQLLSQLNLN